MKILCSWWWLWSRLSDVTARIPFRSRLTAVFLSCRTYINWSNNFYCILIRFFILALSDLVLNWSLSTLFLHNSWFGISRNYKCFTLFAISLLTSTCSQKFIFFIYYRILKMCDTLSMSKSTICVNRAIWLSDEVRLFNNFSILRLYWSVTTFLKLWFP